MIAETEKAVKECIDKWGVEVKSVTYFQYVVYITLSKRRSVEMRNNIAKAILDLPTPFTIVTVMMSYKSDRVLHCEETYRYNLKIKRKP